MAFDTLTGLGYGIITFAIVIGIGLVVLSKFGTAVGAGEANDSITYMMGEIGEDGLASWTPAIIALVVGMLFLGMFLTRGRTV